MTTGSTLSPDLFLASDADLAELSDRMETATASEIVRWAVEEFGQRICVTGSMADTVMVHLAAQVAPDIEVVFLDTGFHFPETLSTLQRATRRYNLNVRIVSPAPGAPDLYTSNTESCCAARKVATLNRALADKHAWMTGLRRSDSPDRALTPIVTRSRGLVKICPIARWTDDDVSAYVAEHNLVMNPLLFDGYPSIGCAPCTSRILEGDDQRAGRWAGSGKTECGIHQ